MDLSKLRGQIDAIDGEILEKIAHRMEISRSMAAEKQKQKVEVFQPDREVQLLAERRNIAEKLGLSEEFTLEIFRLLLHESRKIQQKYLTTSPKTFASPGKLRKKTLALPTLSLSDVFRQIAAEYENFFLLESLGEDEWSEYSFLGFDPEVIVSARGNDFFLNGKKISNAKGKTSLEQLEQFFEPFSGITKEESFCGGLVGFIGTEAAHLFDGDIPISRQKSKFPDFCFGLFLDGLIYDRKRHTLEYFFWDQDRSEMIEKILQKKARKTTLKTRYKSTSLTDQQFEKIVRNIKREIVAGNIWQTVPARRFEYTVDGSLVPFYMRLREVNPSPHMYFLHFGEHQIIGSSPELVAKVSGRKIETFPIAGTRPRGQTPKEDALKAAELLSDEKEVAEHMMLVDMARNDLGRVCEYGSVQIERLMSIKKFSHVQHIVSEISGILRDNISVLRGVMANFPMGTVCGSPRIEAMKILVREEKSPRGPFGGTIGFWSFSGAATFALLIRTLFVHGNTALAEAGAGVVYDSLPEKERQEVDQKTRHVREILEEFGTK